MQQTVLFVGHGLHFSEIQVRVSKEQTLSARENGRRQHRNKTRKPNHFGPGCPVVPAYP
jgi:hypothetical protein